MYVCALGRYAACGFQIQLVRKQVQYLVQVYLPSGMFVITSWVSFLIKPEIVPGRMALLVTLFLVLINIFNSVRQRAPISSSLNALDLYIVVCIFLIFGALMEYAAILFLLSKRRKPRYTIGGGLQTMFSNNGDMNSAAAAAAAAASGPSNAQIAADASNEDLELQTPIIRRSKKVGRFSKLDLDRKRAQKDPFFLSLSLCLSIVVTFPCNEAQGREKTFAFCSARRHILCRRFSLKPNASNLRIYRLTL